MSHLVPLHPNHDRRPGLDLHECEACGALVVDTAKHEAWHEAQPRPRKRPST